MVISPLNMRFFALLFVFVFITYVDAFKSLIFLKKDLKDTSAKAATPVHYLEVEKPDNKPKAGIKFLGRNETFSTPIQKDEFLF